MSKDRSDTTDSTKSTNDLFFKLQFGKLLEQDTSEKNMEMLKKMIQIKNININLPIEAGDSKNALHIVARKGDIKKAEFLLQHGADVNIKDGTGQTVLHYAAAKDHAEMVEFFIKQGVEINTKDSHGYTAIHDAASNGATRVVQVLINEFADLNCKNNNGATPRGVCNNEKLSKLLAENGGR